jgi:hypothetical protein
MHTLWDLWLRYWPDLVIAAVFAVLAEVLRIRSRIVGSWRWLKDKNAEGSLAALDARIAEQEQYRNTLQSYLSSDKAFYMAMLRSMTGILLFMCVAAAVLVLGRIRAIALPGSELVALGVVGAAILLGVWTNAIWIVRRCQDLGTNWKD